MFKACALLLATYARAARRQEIAKEDKFYYQCIEKGQKNHRKWWMRKGVEAKESCDALKEVHKTYCKAKAKCDAVHEDGEELCRDMIVRSRNGNTYTNYFITATT